MDLRFAGTTHTRIGAIFSVSLRTRTSALLTSSTFAVSVPLTVNTTTLSCGMIGGSIGTIISDRGGRIDVRTLRIGHCFPPRDEAPLRRDLGPELSAVERSPRRLGDRIVRRDPAELKDPVLEKPDPDAEC